MARVMSKRELKIANALGDGEALRQDLGYTVNGLVIGRADEVERMARRGFLHIEQVGESRFATRLALQGADHV